jgi:glutamate 5-kinase
LQKKAQYTAILTLSMNKKRIIVKVGTALTTMQDGRLNLPFLANLTEEISHIHGDTFEIVLVSSGAVAAGRRSLYNTDYELTNRQALSCLGQPILMDYYRDFFRVHEKHVGQCLFTTRDFESDEALGIMKVVLNQLLEAGVIPVLNENDAASDIEMKYGDNDQLASRIAILMEADALVLMSDVLGFYDKNPQKFPDAKLLSEIKAITPEIVEMAGHKISEHSMGGMKSKMRAVKRTVEAGIPVHLFSGRETGLLTNVLMKGKREGTFFHAVRS